MYYFLHEPLTLFAKRPRLPGKFAGFGGPLVKASRSSTARGSGPKRRLSSDSSKNFLDLLDKVLVDNRGDQLARATDGRTNLAAR